MHLCWILIVDIGKLGKIYDAQLWHGKGVKLCSLEGANCHVLTCINTDTHVVKCCILLLLRVKFAFIATDGPSYL